MNLKSQTRGGCDVLAVITLWSVTRILTATCLSIANKKLVGRECILFIGWF